MIRVPRESIKNVTLKKKSLALPVRMMLFTEAAVWLPTSLFLGQVLNNLRFSQDKHEVTAVGSRVSSRRTDAVI